MSCPDTQPRRCPWVGRPDSPDIYVRYHDEEWGVPTGDDLSLFKKLVLEGFQAGLSWLTILRKRQRFVECFDGFDPQQIARYDEARLDLLMQEPGIVRNRAKIDATVANARALLRLQETRSLGNLLWSFVDGTPIDHRFERIEQVPAETELSHRIARTLRDIGFRFCGPVGIYALMQSEGMVNDHLLCCHRHDECLQLAEQFTAPEV